MRQEDLGLKASLGKILSRDGGREEYKEGGRKERREKKKGRKEGNLGVKLLDIGLGNDFLGITKSSGYKSKNK
jgi:hypothetical protein